MRRATLFTVAALTAWSAAAVAHDLFLRPGDFFLTEHTVAPMRVFNGTFGASANAIELARVADLTVISPAGRARVDTAGWDASGDTTRFLLPVGPAGTHVLGIATRPAEIELEARDFNQYLREEGVPDELDRRRRAGELARDARERYAKYAKALVQVGAARTGDFAAVLGYPVEFVPLDNPYRMTIGGRFRARVLVDGRPQPGAYVLYGGLTPTGSPITELSTRTNPDGIATVRLTSRGAWYLRLIHLVPLAADSAGATHESRWATLSFGVR